MKTSSGSGIRDRDPQHEWQAVVPRSETEISRPRFRDRDFETEISRSSYTKDKQWYRDPRPRFLFVREWKS